MHLMKPFFLFIFLINSLCLPRVDNNTCILTQVEGVSQQQSFFFFFPFASLNRPNKFLSRRFVVRSPDLCRDTLRGAGGPAERRRGAAGFCPPPPASQGEERGERLRGGAVSLRLAPGTASLPQHNGALYGAE